MLGPTRHSAVTGVKRNVNVLLSTRQRRERSKAVLVKFNKKIISLQIFGPKNTLPPAQSVLVMFPVYQIFNGTCVCSEKKTACPKYPEVYISTQRRLFVLKAVQELAVGIAPQSTNVSSYVNEILERY